MSIFSADLPHNLAARFRSFVAACRSGSASLQGTRINFPSQLDMTFRQKPDHVSVEWEQPIEVSVGIWSPDLIRARLYDDHAVVDLKISNIRINYDA